MKFNNPFVPDVVSGSEQITLYKSHSSVSLTGVTKSCLWCHLDLCVGFSWAQNPGWRSSGGFLVHTPSPGHEQLLCNRFVPDGGSTIHWWGPNQIYSFASLSFLWVLVELSWYNLNLFIFVMDTLNSCWFFFFFYFFQHNWKYFFSGSLGWTSHLLLFVCRAWLPPLSPCLCY